KSFFRRRGMKHRLDLAVVLAISILTHLGPAHGRAFLFRHSDSSNISADGVSGQYGAMSREAPCPICLGASVCAIVPTCTAGKMSALFARSTTPGRQGNA